MFPAPGRAACLAGLETLRNFGTERQLGLLMPTSEPAVLSVGGPMGLAIMSKATMQALLSFPPRSLSQPERDLFSEWLSRAGDIPLAFISQRRSDDPRIYLRIVVWLDAGGEHVYTVHTTSVGTGWLVAPFDQPSLTDVHDTLREALNSIKNVLV